MPERVARFNPDARLIYIMRDPVQRVLSHYRFSVRRADERRDILTAVRERADFVDFSNYAVQLRPYLDLFGPEQIWTFTLEELERAPAATMSAIFEWLGIDSDHDSIVYTQRANVTPSSYFTFRRSSAVYRALRSAAWRNWGRRIPAPLRSYARGAFAGGLELSADDVQRTIDYLRPIQQRQVGGLCELLDRDFPEWTTLYGA